MSIQALETPGPPYAEKEQTTRVVCSMPVRFCFQQITSFKAVTVLENHQQCVLEFANNIRPSPPARFTLEITKRLPENKFETLVRKNAEGLSRQNLDLNGAAVVPIVPPAGYRRASLFAPSARQGNRNFEVVVWMLEHAEAFVAVIMVGPRYAELPGWWAIHKRAFEIIRDSLWIGEPAADPPANPCGTGHDTERTLPTPLPTRKKFLDAGSY